MFIASALAFSHEAVAAEAQTSREFKYSHYFWALAPDNSAYLGTPLSFGRWFARTSFSDVPVLKLGQSAADVRTAVAAAKFEVYTDNADRLVVRGESTEYTGEAATLAFLYEFEDGALRNGPVTFEEARSDWYGRESQVNGFESLIELAEFENSAYALNHVAWVLATHGDESLRNGARAIELAIAANEIMNWESASLLDTLAAAYATAGNFAEAVRTQERALEMLEEPQSDMEVRLELFKNRTAYIEPQEKAIAATPQPDLSIQLAAWRGDALAQSYMAEFLMDNEIKDQYGERYPGTPWLMEAARRGERWAVNLLGYAYMKGAYGVEQDLIKAEKYLRRGANSQYSTAFYNLARLHQGEFGEKFDDALASYWLSHAAKRGMQDALYEYAFRIGEGVGVARDPIRKRQILEDLRNASFDLSKVYFGPINEITRVDGPLIQHFVADVRSQDEAVARVHSIVKVFEKAIDSGKPAATVEVGGMVIALHPDTGRRFAAQLCRVAATHGNAAAQTTLSDYYSRGFGVNVSAVHEKYWSQRAAKNPANGTRTKSQPELDQEIVVDQ